MGFDHSLNGDFGSRDRLDFPSGSEKNSKKTDILVEIDVYRKDFNSFNNSLEKARENYADVIDPFLEEHPEFKSRMDTIEALLNRLNVRSQEFSDEQILVYVDVYNLNASALNRIFTNFKEKYLEEKDVAKAVSGITFNEEDLVSMSEEEKKIIIKFGDSLYEELFPKTSTQFAMEYWLEKLYGQKGGLEDYQKLLLAPANGIEYSVRGLVSLVDPSTYVDIYQGGKTAIQTGANEYAHAWNYIKQYYEQMSGERKASSAITFIFSVAFLFGGFTKLGKFSKGLPGAARLMTLLKFGVRGGLLSKHILKPIPLAVIAGLHLKYMNLPSLGK